MKLTRTDRTRLAWTTDTVSAEQVLRPLLSTAWPPTAIIETACYYAFLQYLTVCLLVMTQSDIAHTSWGPYGTAKWNIYI